MSLSKIERIKQKLSYHAARAVFLKQDEAYETQEIRQLFDQLMNEGIYDDAFLNVIQCKGDTNAEFSGPFNKAIKALGIHFADKREATFSILKEYVLETLEGKWSPQTGFHKIYWDIDYSPWQDEAEVPGAYAELDELGTLDTAWDVYDEKGRYDNVQKKVELDRLNKATLAVLEKWWDTFKDKKNFASI